MWLNLSTFLHTRVGARHFSVSSAWVARVVTHVIQRVKHSNTFHNIALYRSDIACHGASLYRKFTYDSVRILFQTFCRDRREYSFTSVAKKPHIHTYIFFPDVAVSETPFHKVINILKGTKLINLQFVLFSGKIMRHADTSFCKNQYNILRAIQLEREQVKIVQRQPHTAFSTEQCREREKIIQVFSNGTNIHSVVPIFEVN